jgi:hypothetical protein
MTPDEWRTSSDPCALLRRACDRVSPSKLRLLLAAFCARLAESDPHENARLMPALLASHLGGDHPARERLERRQARPHRRGCWVLDLLLAKG